MAIIKQVIVVKLWYWMIIIKAFEENIYFSILNMIMQNIKNNKDLTKEVTLF